jgi:hypothetical protein
MVSNTVQPGIRAFEKRRKIADDRFAAQMAKLVLKVSDIQYQVSKWLIKFNTRSSKNALPTTELYPNSSFAKMTKDKKLEIYYLACPEP